MLALLLDRLGTGTVTNETVAELLVFFCFFYRSMHFSAKRSLAIICRPSVCEIGGL